MHRSGRTGRMYDTGEVITFMTVDDHRRIEKLKEKGDTISKLYND